MTLNTLEKLYTELEQKLQQRLDEIEQDTQSRIAQLEQETQRVHRARMTQRRQTHANQLRQLRIKSTRNVHIQQQECLWRCQQHCIDDVLADARQLLEQQTPAISYLKAWVDRALPRLGPGSNWRLRIPSLWSAQLDLEHVDVKIGELKNVYTSPVKMLGGAILEDNDRHIEIDGSWDLRLDTLTPELWQRWHDDVGTNDQD